MNGNFDFSWGNPYFLLEILDREYTQTLSPYNIKNMSYAEDNGNPLLIAAIKKTLNIVMGLEYKHIVITTGATQAINILLRVLKTEERNIVMTPELGYPFCDEMIKKAGYERRYLNKLYKYDTQAPKINLIDSPSNPLGEQSEEAMVTDPTIWDAVYHNGIYNADMLKKPNHIAMANSYSKTLGLTGVRVGYIATNDLSLYEKCAQECLMENATISVPSQDLIVDILDKVILSDFIRSGAYSLDCNREEFSKIEYLFDNQPVQKTGMFYCANADKKALKVLEKCGIKYVELGDDLIRLSMGQTNEITKAGIKAILKGDKK